MKFGTLTHLAIDLQNRFLFPVDVGQHHSGIGGKALLRDIMAFDTALSDFAVPAIWVASSGKFGRKSGLNLGQTPDGDMRRVLMETHDFPEVLAARLRGTVALKTANSAFSNPALSKRLRRMQVTALLITGLYAGQCIRETVLDAVAAGFYCRVLADLTLDNIPGDTFMLRRKRLVAMFANQPQVEITDAAAIIQELRWVDSGHLEPPPTIVTTKHQSRILLHHFRQESQYSGAVPAMTSDTQDVWQAFQAMQKEVT